MGDAPGAHDPQARVPGRRGLTPRRRAIATSPLGYGLGHECTYPAALAAASGAEYDWLMGCSGAAFGASIDAVGWDPHAATPHDPDTLERGARAAGVRLDPVEPPFDDDLKPLVLERVCEGLDERLPPLIRGVAGPPEFGLIVGCDPDAGLFECRTFFDKGGKPTKIGWDAFQDATHGMPFFLDRAAPVDRAALAGAALRDAAAQGAAGREAVGAWIGALRDDARWADRSHAGAAAFADHAMRATLHDRRAAAARFLRGLRTLFADLPGADLVVAAEAYANAATQIARGGIGPFDGSVALRFLDAGHRRGLANFLEQALVHEAAGLTAIAGALAHFR